MTFFEARSAPADSESRGGNRNPFDMVIAFGGPFAILLGSIIALVAQQIYDKDAVVAGYANSFSGGGSFAADTSALWWVNFGGELVQLGALFLAGSIFYFATQWRKAHKTA